MLCILKTAKIQGGRDKIEKSVDSLFMTKRLEREAWCGNGGGDSKKGGVFSPTGDVSVFCLCHLSSKVLRATLTVAFKFSGCILQALQYRDKPLR
jgi:hypothetical protein